MWRPIAILVVVFSQVAVCAELLAHDPCASGQVPQLGSSAVQVLFRTRVSIFNSPLDWQRIPLNSVQPKTGSCFDIDAGTTKVVLLCHDSGRDPHAPKTLAEQALMLFSTVRVSVTGTARGTTPAAAHVPDFQARLIKNATLIQTQSSDVTVTEFGKCGLLKRWVGGYLPVAFAAASSNFVLASQSSACVVVTVCGDKRGATLRLHVETRAQLLDWRYLGQFVAGLATIVLAPTVGHSITVYYATATVVSGFLVLGLVFMVLSRKSPRLAASYLGGVALSFVYGQSILEEILTMLGDLALPVGGTALVVVMATVYWWGPPTDRTLNVLEWALMLTGGVMIATATSHWQVGAVTGLLTVLVVKSAAVSSALPPWIKKPLALLALPFLLLFLWPARRLLGAVMPRPAQRRLTLDEFERQGRFETQKAVKALEQTLATSPTAKLVASLARLSDPRPTLQFLQTGRHISDATADSWNTEDHKGLLRAQRALDARLNPAFSDDDDDDGDDDGDDYAAIGADEKNSFHPSAFTRTPPKGAFNYTRGQFPDAELAHKTQEWQLGYLAMQGTRTTQGPNHASTQGSPAYKHLDVRYPTLFPLEPQRPQQHQQHQQQQPQQQLYSSSANYTLEDVKVLSDRELLAELKQHGIKTGPITPDTRALYQLKLVGKRR